VWVCVSPKFFTVFAGLRLLRRNRIKTFNLKGRRKTVAEGTEKFGEGDYRMSRFPRIEQE
jgi:hypothetical protein